MNSPSICKADIALALVAGRPTIPTADVPFNTHSPFREWSPDRPVAEYDRLCLFIALGTLASPDIRLDKRRLGGVLTRLSEEGNVEFVRFMDVEEIFCCVVPDISQQKFRL
jgi:hypothetical protein